MIYFYGGSFNPPHLGHLYCAILSQFYGKVIILPNYRNPLKDENEYIFTDKQRYELCRLLFPSTIEINDIMMKMKLLYLKDVFPLLQKIYNVDRFGFIIGDDVLKQLEQFNNVYEIFKYIENLIVFTRNYTYEELISVLKKYDFLKDVKRIISLNAPIIRSSTEIRNLLRKGKYEKIYELYYPIQRDSKFLTRLIEFYEENKRNIKEVK